MVEFIEIQLKRSIDIGKLRNQLCRELIVKTMESKMSSTVTEQPPYFEYKF